MKRAFDYILDRDINCQSVISVMNTRKNLRIGSDRKGEGSAQKMDKTVNPLIAVPGAPGISISTLWSTPCCTTNTFRAVARTQAP